MQLLGGVTEQLLFVGLDSLHVERAEEANRLGQTDSTDVVGRTGLELEWHGGKGGLLKRDAIHHVATPHKGRHRLQEFALAIQDTDTGRAVEFMTREGVEVAIQGLHIDTTMHHTLATIHQHHRTDCVGSLDDGS